MTSEMQRAAEFCEKVRPYLNSMGIDFRELHGQTMFAHYASDDMFPRKAVVYVGRLGANAENDSEWETIIFEPTDVILRLISEAVPSMMMGESNA